MMTELSLNVLDVAQNSVKAGAKLIEISVIADSHTDRLVITINDNGCGMSDEQVTKVTDPFFTTRTTREVGLGIPFFKLACETTGGAFEIKSKLDEGTLVKAEFVLSHIDRMPLGDMPATMLSLVTMNIDIDFVYRFRVNEKEFIMDTREFREVLEGIPFNTPEVSRYIKEYLEGNQTEVQGDIVI
ncbi:MAG: ATP-binding protein [Clostridiales bacterium]|nr:ATP-binding protein [Clostridiales bacterium]